MKLCVLRYGEQNAKAGHQRVCEVKPTEKASRQSKLLVCSSLDTWVLNATWVQYGYGFP